MQMYRILFYLIGMSINFLGAALIVKATVGTGFWTALFVGLRDNFGFTVGVWYATSMIVTLFVNAMLLKKLPEIQALIPIILESIIFDFWLEIVLSRVDLASQLVLLQSVVFLAGVILIGLGVAVYIMPGFPRSPMDQLFLAVKERFKLTMKMAQTLVAIFVAAIAFLIGGPVGYGSLFAAIALGPLIQFWYSKVLFVYQSFHPKHANSKQYQYQYHYYQDQWSTS